MSRIHRPSSVCVLAWILSAVWFTDTASAQAFRVATWNVMSGFGQQELAGGRRLFTGNSSNCSINAWGSGYMKNELTAKVGGDPAVVALGIQEAWTCATPEAIRVHLGWAARTSDVYNGLGIVARYGFAPGSRDASIRLVTPASKDLRYVLHRPVCLNSACSATIDVFVTHWGGAVDSAMSDAEAVQTITFMSQRVGFAPHVLMGDLNVWEEGEGTRTGCGLPTYPYGLSLLRNSGYVDAWNRLRPIDEGYTATLNRNGCGTPNGDAFKRIDFVWAFNVNPLSIERFGLPQIVGDTVISDHLGLNAHLSLSGGDTTPPTVSMTAPPHGASVTGTVLLTANASDDVAVTRVDFLLDGTVINTDASAPYSVSWNSTTVADGSHTLTAQAWDAAANVGSSAAVSVTVNNTSGATWIHLANASAQGATIDKTGGCGTCPDAGGHTVAEITGGDGYAQFTPSSGHYFLVGLGNDKTLSTDLKQIDFGFAFWPGGAFSIRENGIYKGEGRFAAGDVFKVAIEAGIVKYYQNATLLYTSATVPTYPLVLDTTLVSIGSKVMNATVTGGGGGGGGAGGGAGRVDVVWTSVVRATATGNVLQKTSGCGSCADAGGVSQQQITAAGGSVQFTPSFGHLLFAGAGGDTSVSTDAARIDYAFGFWAGGVFDIRENGVYKAEGTFAAGDAFTIVVDAGVVSYYRNGTLVYTSLTAPVFPLVLDATLIDTGATLSNAAIVF